MKSNLLYVAMVLIVLCIPFYGNENEVRWLWTNLPQVPLIFVCIALLCLAVYIYRKEAINSRK